MLRPLIEERRTLVEEHTFRYFSAPEARRVGNKIGVDWTRVPVSEFQMGLHHELEHGKWDKQTDVTHDDLVKTGKIALAHLKEDPHYYKKLRAAHLG